MQVRLTLGTAEAQLAGGSGNIDEAFEPTIVGENSTYLGGRSALWVGVKF